MDTTSATKCCKACNSLSSEVKWVTKHGEIEGLVCLACTAAKQKAKKQTVEGSRLIKEAQLKCSRKVRSTESGRAKANKAAVASNTKRRKADPLYALKIRLRNRINNAFNRIDMTKTSSCTVRNGINSTEVVRRLILQSGLPPEKAKLLTIDHILPMNLARTVEDAETLNSGTNLQLITAEENEAKSDFLADGRRARDLTDKEAMLLVATFRATLASY